MTNSGEAICISVSTPNSGGTSPLWALSPVIYAYGSRTFEKKHNIFLFLTNKPYLSAYLHWPLMNAYLRSWFCGFCEINHKLSFVLTDYLIRSNLLHFYRLKFFVWLHFYLVALFNVLACYGYFTNSCFNFICLSIYLLILNRSAKRHLNQSINQSITSLIKGWQTATWQ